MSLSTPAQAVVDRVTAKRSGTGDVPHDPTTDRLVLLAEVVKKLDAGGGGGGGDYLPLAGGTMNESAEITFTNNSRIRQTPGANGIDQVCSIEYVHRWKEGSLYILDTANNIRVVMYGIATPDSSFDFTQGYTIGSRVIKDDGTTYVCTDSTEAAAVWTESIAPINKGGTGATTAAGARTNLGLGSVATESTVPVAKGGTGATTAAAAAVAIVNGNPIAPSTIGVSANGAASSPPATLTGTWYSGGSATTTKPQLLLEPTGTNSTGWNTAGTGLGVNAVSGFTGRLLDLQLNGSSSCYIGYQGQIATTFNGSFGNSQGIAVLLEFYNGLRFGNQANLGLSWSNNVSPSTSVDTGVYRDAAGFLGQRSGTTPQGFSVYGTYTSATNYERVKICYNGATSTFQIGTEKGSGGGTARALEIVVDGTVRGRFDTSGNFTPNTDNSGGLGTNSFRWNNIRVAGDIVGTRIGHYSSLGAFSLVDGSGFDWGRLCFGGATSAYPAIKRVSAGIDFRVGDDSAFAATQSLYQRFGSGTPEGTVTAPVGATFHRTDGGAGTSFYVKESGSGNTGWVAK